MASPTDNTWAIVRETIEGQTPATPSFTYIDNNTGNATDLSFKTLTSESMKANRALVDASKTSYSSTMTIKNEFRRDSALDLLLESALSGKFDGNGILKASNVDSTHTIEHTITGKGVVYRQRNVGMIVNKLGLTIDAGAYAGVTYGLIGMGRTDTAPAVTGASYAAPTQGSILRDRDMGTITIAGLTATFMTLDLSVEHTRDPKFGLGSANSFGTATSKPRQVKLTLKLYRDDFSPEALFIPDNKLAVSFNLGSAANGYSFTLPACVGMVPKSDSSGSAEMVTVDLMAVNDATTGTDIQITKTS